ncbi:MAG TPA: methionyl-tRNA formyltransferase [Fimbriimonadaceae bacterium]|nr:methionyl-tRNA formyltransferase [Fimbriimonadaceae bacterium]HRJ97542.1 methionyl-tRNA formyltransferase [Fimbriimonadaceae bacterium]
MKLVFFGSAEFAVPALRAVAPHVVLVVTQPDRPSGRGHRLHSTAVKQVAIELGLPVEAPERCRTPEFVERLRAFETDALLVAAYGQILSQAVLESARQGGINLHGSILPKYRGAAPIPRAILEGEHETGVTLMQMDKGMDSGDIIAIERTPIGPDETAGQLQERLATTAAAMASEWMPKIVAGAYPRTPQNHELATLAPKIVKEEAELRFEREAEGEYARFRAFTPSPGPFVVVECAPVRLRAIARATPEGRPGEILATSPDLIIAFEKGSLGFLEVQPAGKRPISGRDWANGMRLRVGDRLADRG